MVKFRQIDIDPTDLQPGDVVVQLGEHEISGCHCDVRVTVQRPVIQTTFREVIASQIREAQRSPLPDFRTWHRLYEWLAEQAKQGYAEAEENELAANLDASAGPAYMAEAYQEVRSHMRRVDPALPGEAFMNEL